MNKEQVKKILPILRAFQNNKPLQAKRIDDENAKYVDWGQDVDLDFDNFLYRIKPEPVLVAYSIGEMYDAIIAHRGYVFEPKKMKSHHITSFDNRSILLGGLESRFSYDELARHFVWLDDRTPCANVIEQE